MIRQCHAAVAILSVLATSACNQAQSPEDDTDFVEAGLCSKGLVFVQYPKSEPEFVPAWGIRFPGATLNRKVLQCIEGKPHRASAVFKADESLDTVSAYFDELVRSGDLAPTRSSKGISGASYVMETNCGGNSVIRLRKAGVYNGPEATEISYQIAYCSEPE
tara:strand:- start:11603 stop:12088 length:486 start_codon:yes stop_codon:yes gene_type:complete